LLSQIIKNKCVRCRICDGRELKWFVTVRSVWWSWFLLYYVFLLYFHIVRFNLIIFM